MLEYIERDTAIKALMNDAPEQVSYSREDAADCIRYIDATDVTPVRHGHWIEHKHFHHAHYIDSTYECSECKVEEPLTSDYCPNCGAKMDLED